MPMGSLLLVLEEQFGSEFVRGGMAEQQGEETLPWLQFQERPSEEAVSVIEASLAEVRVYYGAPANFDELEELAERVMSHVAASDLEISAGTEYEWKEPQLVLSYSVPDGVGSDEVRLAIDRAIEATAQEYDNQELPISVVAHDSRMPPPEAQVTVEGGRNLNPAGDPNGLVCTGGFTAVRSGDRGQLTAEHCVDNLWYGTVSGIMTTNPATPVSSQIDAQYHRTITGNGHVTNAQFRARGFQPEDDRVALDYGTPALNSTACHWGRTSYYECAEVQDVNECRTYSGNLRCGLDITTPDTGEGGDSGGPWFLLNRAYGTHSAGYVGPGPYSYYTRISRIMTALDVNLVFGD